MRRREKFVLAALFLSVGLALVQYTGLEWRYYAIAGLMAATYGVSAWALSDDLQVHEWSTILPFPVIYTAAVALFYFLFFCLYSEEDSILVVLLQLVLLQLCIHLYLL